MKILVTFYFLGATIHEMRNYLSRFSERCARLLYIANTLPASVMHNGTVSVQAAPVRTQAYGHFHKDRRSVFIVHQPQTECNHHAARFVFCYVSTQL